MTPTDRVLLNNRLELPPIGFGTYDIYDDKVLQQAMDAGYTLFDNAPNYANLEQMGKALSASGKREDLFLIEKVETWEQPYGAKKAVKNCLQKTGQNYFDMYLMHFPHPDYYLKTWREMEMIYQSGIVRSIGVCNFGVEQLERLLQKARVVPAVNQIELHPLFPQKETVQFCKQNGIRVMAYSPLARMDRRLFDDPTLLAIAQSHQKSIAQVILRWNIQSGFIPIPKTTSYARMQHNLELFDFCLSDQEMARIDAMDCNGRIRKDPNDPTIYPAKPALHSVLKVKLLDLLTR